MQASGDVGVEEEEDIFDWEEWNPSKGSFLTHSIAGSAAGAMEHVAIFPLDTIKTHMQVLRGGAHSPPMGIWAYLRQVTAHEGFGRLWRGSSAMLTACVPAHAAYFTIYESVKEMTGANAAGHHPIAAATAGAVAVVAHDAIMTPMDVCKQRMQLGHYDGMLHAMRSMVAKEGTRALFRSFPTTLLMNMPYGSVMVATNESLRRVLQPLTSNDVLTFLLAGAGAGACAAAVTNPMDVAKTRLQTQSLTVKALPRSQGGAAESSARAGATTRKRGWKGLLTSSPSAPKRSHTTAGGTSGPLYHGMISAMKRIYAEEGWRGFLQGLRPRLAVHAPSVAISWTTYETVKSLLDWD